MNFDLTHEGRTTLAVDYAGAIALNYPVAVAGAALKGAAVALVGQMADSYRARLSSGSAGKLAEFRFKEEISRDPAKAAPAEMALIDREAKARGIKKADFLAAIAAKAAAYRQIALLIGVLEAEAGAAISAVPDADPDIQVRISALLAFAKEEADKAFRQAITLINGGA